MSENGANANSVGVPDPGLSAFDRLAGAVDSALGGNDPQPVQQLPFQDPNADVELRPMHSRRSSRANDVKDEKDGKGSSSDVKDKKKVTGDGSDSDEDDRPKNTPAVFNRPLVYYKRNTPFMRLRARDKGPTQIIWPDKSMSIGFMPDKAAERDRERKNDENMVVFTSPNEEAHMRRKRLLCMCVGALAAECILVTSQFATADTMNDTDILAYVALLLSLVLALGGLRYRDPRILTLFLVVFYADSFISLLRMVEILDWLRFFLQLVICYWIRQFKESLLPTWFIPQSA